PKRAAMKRMSMKKFSQIVRQVMETLPPEFGPYLDNLVVDVEEEPSRELLRQMDYSEDEIADGEMMYGLFCPLGPESSDLGGADFENPPRRIVIYKRPLEEDFPDRQEL